jgi:hypothetical protein
MLKRFIGVIGVMGMLAAAACGGEGDGGQGGAGGGSSTSGAGQGAATTGSGSTTTFGCCINEESYTCPTQEAAEQCSNGEPSGCQKLAEACGSSSGDPSSSASSGGGGDDIGKECEFNSDCMTNTCLFKPGADLGFCSKTCMSFADCPSFWSCTEIENGSATYCVPD